MRLEPASWVLDASCLVVFRPHDHGPDLRTQVINGKLSEQIFGVCSHPGRKPGDIRLTQELHNGLQRILASKQIWQEEVETLHCSLLGNMDRAVFQQHPDSVDAACLAWIYALSFGEENDNLAAARSSTSSIRYTVTPGSGWSAESVAEMARSTDEAKSTSSQVLHCWRSLSVPCKNIPGIAITRCTEAKYTTRHRGSRPDQGSDQQVTAI
jgi:hypothetical protein